MANYTLGVVAHQYRKVQINRLENQVNPDIVMVDDGSLGVTTNHIWTLRDLYSSARRSGQSWLVVLEDDAEPVIGFNRQVTAALDVAPTAIVSFYNGSGHPAGRQARFKQLSQRHDVDWITWKYLRHGVAYAIHVDVIELGLIEAMVKLGAQEWAPDDAISNFALGKGIRVSYSNPSLVDHEDGPTMIKTRTARGMPMLARRRSRRAHWVGTRMTWGDRTESI